MPVDDNELIELLTDRIIQSVRSANAARRQKFAEEVADFQTDPFFPLRQGVPANTPRVQKPVPEMAPLALVDRSSLRNSIVQWIAGIDTGMVNGYDAGCHLAIQGISVVPASMVREDIVDG